MDRYPGYESMLTRVEHMKMQVKAQLPTEYSQTVDNMVDFVLDELNQCCDVATADATTDTSQDHLLPGSNGLVARVFADDTRLDVSEHVNTVDHQREATSGSISNEQTVSPPSVTQSTIPTNIEVKVEDESNGQSVQLCEWIKKEEDEDDYEGQLFHCCDCGGEGCEECRVKLEIKEEFDESGCKTELGGSSVQSCIRVKKEEEDSEGEGVRPKKMRRMDRVFENFPNGSPSLVSTNVIPFNVECTDNQMATSSTNSLTIEGNQTFSDVSSGQLVQHFKCVKKEEEDGGEYVMECDCEDCETCRVKMEMKEERDESGEIGEGRGDGEGESPSNIRRMNQMVVNVQIGSPSRNVEYINDQMATSSTIEDHTQPSQPITIPLPTQIGRPTQTSAQHVNEIEPLRDELLNGEPMMDNVVEVREEFDRGQVDEDNSTLNRVHTDQDFEEDDEEEGDETIEQREELSAGDEPQLPAENFVKRIKPADELGNSFECDYRGCGKRTKRKCDLIKHIRTHTGEKRYKCSVAACDRAFFQKSNLDEHIRTHTGDRPFVCTWPDCGQAFARSSNLKTHSLVHSNERSFVCDVTGCTKVYKHKRALRRHQKDQHNLP